MRIPAVVLFVLLALPAFSQTPATTTPVKPKVTTIADLAWLTGTWVGENSTGKVEEVWTAPEAGLMLGMFRYYTPEKTLVLQLFTLRQTPEGVVFDVRRFSPDLIAREEKDSPIRLPLTSLEQATVIFDNTGPESLRRVVMTQTGADSLYARSEMLVEGKEQKAEITLKRVKP